MPQHVINNMNVQHRKDQYLSIYFCFAISTILFVSARRQVTYPGICGSSGTVFKNLSNAALKASFEQPFISRAFLDTELNNCTAFTLKLEFLNPWNGPRRINGTWHNLPNRIWLCVVIDSNVGTIPSIILLLLFLF